MRRRAAALLVLSVLATVTACTPSDPAPGTTSTIVTTETRTVSPPPPTTEQPVSTGPTSAAGASACPYLSLASAADNLGMRLDRITVLRADGAVVGCRIYALQEPNGECSQACLDAENLPPASQPALEITSARYADANAAHNALVRLSETGTAVQQAQIANGTTGLCFQISFYSKDNGQDWSCAFNNGATLVHVKTVVTSPALNAIEVARVVAPKF